MREREDGAYIVIERQGSGVGPFLVGALLGAGAALLYAPRSGEETRKEIEERARRLKEATEERIREVQEDLEDRFDQARAGMRERVDSVRDAVDSGRRAAVEARHELEDRLERSKSAYRAGVDAARREAEQPEGEGPLREGGEPGAT